MSTLTADMTVGQRIRWARKEVGLSQERLALMIGTTRQVVIRWERDKHLPNALSRDRLAEALDQEADFFADTEVAADEKGGLCVRLIAPDGTNFVFDCDLQADCVGIEGDYDGDFPWTRIA